MRALGAILWAPKKDLAGWAAELQLLEGKRREISMIWSENELGTPREVSQGARGTCQGRACFNRGLLGF